MLKVLELFAGIGACSTALGRLGIEHEIVDAVEIDKYAMASFNAIHGTNFEPQDICKWNKVIECDLIMHRITLPGLLCRRTTSRWRRRKRNEVEPYVRDYQNC